MFRKVKALLVVFVMVTLLAACATVQAKQPSDLQAAPTAALSQREREITVVGVGRVSLVPDVAKINVGVDKRAATVSEAKAVVDEQMEAISATLTELGVAEKDVQTSYYSIYYEQEPYQPFPREEGSGAEPKRAYRVSSILEVTVRDVEKAGPVALLLPLVVPLTWAALTRPVFAVYALAFTSPLTSGMARGADL